MQVGYSARDITPSPGVTLSGFAARCNRPSTGIDDPIEVHALAINQGHDLAILLVFDLLGLGPEVTAAVRRAVLAAVKGRGWGEPHLILCCTHTHSAPATIKLLGCGTFDTGYWSLVERSAGAVATEALGRLQPASVRYSVREVTGVSYNRRKVLADGRVVMSSKPDQPVLRSGPTWDRALLVRFETGSEMPIAGLVSWAAHPCVVCTSNISADYPGELRRSLEKLFGFPFIFLQGPCGNINLPFQEMTRAEMLDDVRKVTRQLSAPHWSSPNSDWAVQHAGRGVSLKYGPSLSVSELQSIRDGMMRISETTKGPESTMRLLANILNVDPGSHPDPALVRHTAGALSQWSSSMIAGAKDDSRTCELALDVVRLGPLWFTFVAAELFAETGLMLQQRFQEAIVTPVGYASPLVGYLPTDEALAEGGYEVEYAYRFYGRPAPFAAGSEPAVRNEIEQLILAMEGHGA